MNNSPEDAGNNFDVLETQLTKEADLNESDRYLLGIINKFYIGELFSVDNISNKISDEKESSLLKTFYTSVPWLISKDLEGLVKKGIVVKNSDGTFMLKNIHGDTGHEDVGDIGKKSDAGEILKGDHNKEKTEEWTVPEGFIDEFNKIFYAVPDGSDKKRKLSVFKEFGIEASHNEEYLKAKLLAAKRFNAFTGDEYKTLLSLLEPSEGVQNEQLGNNDSDNYSVGEKVNNAFLFRPENHPVTSVDDGGGTVEISLPEPKYPPQVPKPSVRQVNTKPAIVVTHPVITADTIKGKGVVPPNPIYVEPKPAIPFPESFNEPVIENTNDILPKLKSNNGVVENHNPIYGEISGPNADEEIEKLGKKYEKTEEILREELNVARDNLAKYESQRKQQIIEGKKKFRAIMEKLGVAEKQRPLPDHTEEYKEAKKAYNEAQWKLKNFIAGINIKKTSVRNSNPLIGAELGGERIIDVGVFKQTENEARIFIEHVDDLLPEKDRWEITKMRDKALEAWSKIPLTKRIAISTLVLLPATFITGQATVASVSVAAGIRVGQAGLGVGMAMGVGKTFDGIRRRKLNRDREARLDQFGESDAGNKDTFDERQQEMTSAIEKELKDDKAHRRNKAYATMAVGGAMAIGSGVISSSGLDAMHTDVLDADSNIGPIKAPEVEINDPDGHSFLDRWFGRNKNIISEEPISIKYKSDSFLDEDGINKNETVLDKSNLFEGEPKKTSSFLDKWMSSNKKTSVENLLSEKSFEEVADPVEVDTYTEPVKVELSSKGFIDTISQFKELLKDKALSPELSKLMDQSPEKIAMDLGLYKPDQVAESAFGLKGDEMTLSADGKISIMHSDSEVETLFDNGQVTSFKGKMIDTDSSSYNPDDDMTRELSPDAKTIESIFDEKEVPLEQPKVPETLENTEPPKAQEVVSTQVENSVSTGTRIFENNLLVGDMVIATATEGYESSKDIVLGKLPLNREYQFINDSGARHEYTKFFERTIASLDPEMRAELFDYRMHFPYKGGQINMFQKGEYISILLNGQKIGSTKLIDGNFAFQYETELGGSMFGVKSEYEVALEEAKKFLVKNAKLFKVLK